MIFQAKVARPHSEAVRAGWNDAACVRIGTLSPSWRSRLRAGTQAVWSSVRSSKRVWCSGPLYRNRCRDVRRRPECGGLDA